MVDIHFQIKFNIIKITFEAGFLIDFFLFGKEIDQSEASVLKSLQETFMCHNHCFHSSMVTFTFVLKK